MAEFTICIEHTILNEALGDNEVEMERLLREMNRVELRTYRAVLRGIADEIDAILDE